MCVCMYINTAAAAKLLQSWLTLCDPIDGSPPGSAVPGILQARTLEWVAISFSNAWKWKVKVKSLSRVRLLVTPWTAAYQGPPSMGFSRQDYWSGVPLPSPYINIYVHIHICIVHTYTYVYMYVYKCIHKCIHMCMYTFNTYTKEEKLKAREKRQIYPTECRVPENSKER